MNNNIWWHEENFQNLSVKMFMNVYVCIKELIPTNTLCLQHSYCHYFTEFANKKKATSYIINDTGDLLSFFPISFCIEQVTYMEKQYWKLCMPSLFLSDELWVVWAERGEAALLREKNTRIFFPPAKACLLYLYLKLPCFTKNTKKIHIKWKSDSFMKKIGGMKSANLVFSPYRYI